MKAEKEPPRTDDGPDALERFESLARRLVAVPKKEIDRRVKAHERKKQNRS